MKKPSAKIIKIIAGALCAVLVLGIGAWALEALSDDTFRFDTPTYISPNSKTEGVINSKDDYEAYIVDIPENGALSISLDHDNFAETLKDGWIITLYKISETKDGRNYDEVTYFKSFWSDVTSSWGETGVGKGEYLILVEPGEFMLDVSFTLVLRFVKTGSFEREFNDTKETATVIEGSKEIFGSSSQRRESNDVDWFKLILKENGFINITFTHEDKSLPVVAWLVTMEDESGTVLCDFSSKLSETSVSSGDISLKAGTYYVRVDSQVVYGNTYGLNVVMSEGGEGEYEPNDSPEEATLLEMGETVNACLSPRLLGLDKDYYKITLPSDGYIDISFSHAPEDRDYAGWNIRLLKKEKDGTYTELVKKLSYWSDSERTVSGIGLTGGEYYILIDADSTNYNSASYKLSWSFTPHDSYEKEPNDTHTEANEVELNRYYYGKLITKDVYFDNDYFVFTVNKPQNVCVQLHHTTEAVSSVAWTISILNDIGETVASVMSSKSEDAVSTGVVALDEAGKYYIHIETGMVESEEEYSFIIIS